MNTLDNQRDASIDLLKAAAILFVILGHSIQYTSPNFDEKILFRIIYSFHMPLFMFLSGFLTYKKQLARDFISKRFSTLVIPFMTWAVLYDIFYNFESLSSGNLAILLDFLLGIVKSPDNGGLWFLWVLFALSSIYFIAQKFQHKYSILAGIGACLYLLGFVHVPPYFGLNLIKWHIGFFVLGIAFKEFNISPKIKWSYFMILAPILIFLEAIWSRLGSYALGFALDSKWQQVYDLVTSYFVALVAIVTIKRISDQYSGGFPGVEWVSKNTLGFYSIHFMVLFTSISLAKEIFPESWLTTPAVFITTCMVTTALIGIFAKIRIISKYALGKEIRTGIQIQ